jgi:hypothetical protein
MHESVVVIVVVVLAHLLAIHTIANKMGFGKHGGKPDWSCGSCETRKKRRVH